MKYKNPNNISGMPEHINPMLCTLVKDPIVNEAYIFELKWDGYRMVSRVENNQVRMNSRGGLDYTSKYPLVAEALESLGHDLIIDGEVVVLNDEGKPDFDTLQLYNGKRTPIRYCVFDLLYLDGNSLMDLPLYQRKGLLKTLTEGNDIFLFSESFDDGKALYKKVLEDNLEGIVAKKKDSVYVPGARGYDWLKVPTRKRQEFVIGGWAESDKSRAFKHLLFGAYEKGKLQWIGRSGGGYKQAEMPGILKILEEIEIDDSPFANKILDPKGAKTHFVEPKLVANFEFATWTTSGRIRKPATFLGFRKDKNAKDVVREVPKEPEAVEEVIEKQQLLTKVKDEQELQTAIIKKDQSVISGFTILEVAMANPEALNQSTEDTDDHQSVQEPSIKHSTVGELFPKSKNKRSIRSKLSAESNWNKIFEEKIKSEGSVAIDDQVLTLTNIEKNLWKQTNKASLIAYYNSVAEYILPHLKDRPLSLHIKNLNAGAPGFYIKDMEGFQPDFLDIRSTKRKHKVKGKADVIDYAVCNNLPSLLWLINLGCIDLNPWNSTTKNPQEPDFIAIDLDPSDEDFKKAVKTALAAKEYFNEQKLTAFIKTSGKTGIHMFIPCKGFTFPQARTLAEHICAQIHKRVPMFTTLEISVDKRGNKLFVDFSQNDEADTLASAYSVRPDKQPNVSTPIRWDELNLELKPTDFTITNMPARLLEMGDLWKDFHHSKIKSTNTKILQIILHDD